MRIRLDRSLPVALAEQIRNQILYSVSMGLLPVGSRLPSVRELSAELKVAPMTISHAYRELAREGVIVTRPGAGTFVTDLADMEDTQVSIASRDSLHQIIDSAVHQAIGLGYSLDEIRQAFLSGLAQRNENGSSHRAIIVGNFQTATESYAVEIENILSDLRVDVQVVLLRDLRAELQSLLPDLKSARLVIAIPTRLQEVRALLEPHECHVVALAFRVSADTRRQLAGVAPTERVGVVATYLESLQTLIDEIGSFCLAKMPPACALLGHDESIRDMLRQIDVLVYASGSEQVLEWIPPSIKAIELRHSPDPDSVRRLRPFFI
jgi:DNA-binding transcriptional regulator YhcF (GntR family)